MGTRPALRSYASIPACTPPHSLLCRPKTSKRPRGAFFLLSASLVKLACEVRDMPAEVGRGNFGPYLKPQAASSMMATAAMPKPIARLYVEPGFEEAQP